MIVEQHRCRVWQLDGLQTPVRAARRHTMQALDDWRLTADTDSAILLVSEIVTNAFSHGAPPVLLQLSATATALQVAVSDACPTPPERRESGEGGGFGLGIIEALAKVTVHQRPDGKLITAVMDLSDGNRD
ncbi:ATP-binding protein [Actinomadura scrupuli]|uniref:ATP-binding protein n=1 Tax=Actinomadura scrupuli TaxID=559629 RepID=UPI003D966982